MLLEAHFRKKLAFFTLQVDIETGDGVFALLGASGSGKSMTLKCIAGIERPDEGRIVLDGRVLFDAEKRIDLPPQKRRVGYMFQDYALFPNMTVRENVMAGIPRGGKSVRGGIFGKRRQADLPAERAQAVLPSERAQAVRLSERTHTPAEDIQAQTSARMRTPVVDIQAQTDDLLATFQIEEIAELKPAKLSGGQKQRVAMARILMQRPDVILLDEPFAALDSYLKWQLEQEMAATLKQIGKPVIFVSHSRDEVYHLADRVCVLSGGRTGEAAETKAFFADPGTRAAALLSGCKNVAAAERVDAHTLDVPAWGIRLRVRREVPEGIDGVGIRAHAFKVGDGEGTLQDAEQNGSGTETAAADSRSPREPVESYDNYLPVLDSAILEDPFEWTVSFRAAEGADRIQWKTAKTGESPLAIPKTLNLDSKSIMLLKG